MDISGALLSAAIGCGSWVLFAFAGQPIRRFWDIRGEVANACNQYARFIAEPPKLEEKMWLASSADRDAARAEFKRLALGLMAFDENETLASLALRGLGYRPAIAARLLLQMSEALETQMSLGPRRSEILRFLRLPP